MKNEPKEIFNQARAAVQNKDYQAALQGYRWFYDNALSIDDAYYGVRLTYCLSEWVNLGKEFAPALHDLISAKEQALTAFRQLQTKEAFQTYSSLCRALSCSEDAYHAFCEVQDEALSSKIFMFIYEYCASNSMRDLCYQHLGDGYSQYTKSLAHLDEMLTLADKNPNVSSESVRLSGINSFKKQASYLLTMLKHVNALEQYDTMISKLATDLKARKIESAFSEIVDHS